MKIKELIDKLSMYPEDSRILLCQTADSGIPYFIVTSFDNDDEASSTTSYIDLGEYLA